MGPPLTYQDFSNPIKHLPLDEVRFKIPSDSASDNELIRRYRELKVIYGKITIAHNLKPPLHFAHFFLKNKRTNELA